MKSKSYLTSLGRGVVGSRIGSALRAAPAAVLGEIEVGFASAGQGDCGQQNGLGFAGRASAAVAAAVAAAVKAAVEAAVEAAMAAAVKAAVAAAVEVPVSAAVAATVEAAVAAAVAAVLEAAVAAAVEAVVAAAVAAAVTAALEAAWQRSCSGGGNRMGWALRSAPAAMALATEESSGSDMAFPAF